MALLVRSALPAVLLLGLVGSGFGAADVPDTARFFHEQGFRASGTYEGTCTVHGVNMQTDEPASLAFTAERLLLTIYQTWRNSTVLYEPIGKELQAFMEQSSKVIELPPGEARLAWNEASHLALHQSHAPRADALTAELRGAQWNSGAPQKHLPSGPGIYPYAVDGGITGDDVVLVKTSIAGPARSLTTEQESFPVRGDGVFEFDGATLIADDFHWTMPPFVQTENQTDTPFVHLRSTLVTHARLEVEGLHAEIPATHGRLACGALEWTGSGSVTYRLATGDILTGGAQHDIERQEITLNGSFTSSDDPLFEDTEWGTRVVSKVASDGTFVAGADYEPLSGASVSVLDFGAQATLLGLLGALALAAWKLAPSLTVLFTRLDREAALRHPLRKLLHEAAHERAGTSMAEVVQKSGRSYSTIQHHSRILSHLGLLSVVRFGRGLHLFPPGTARGKARQLICMRSDPVRFLVDRLDGKGHPMQAVRAELQETFQRGPSWATRIVKQAEQHGLVTRERTEEGVMLCAPRG